MNEAAQGSVLAPGKGRALVYRLGANHLIVHQTVKVGPESGSQHFGMFESVLPAGAVVFLHRHHSYEEAFYVLEGEITYRLGEREVTASAGTCVFIPAGVVHGFKNSGPGPARHLVIHAPVQALAAIEALGQASVEQIPELLAKYDSEFIANW
jgi:quercetin dioxygenase-like cupin family protein